jgi:hypothetical protein
LCLLFVKNKSSLVGINLNYNVFYGWTCPKTMEYGTLEVDQYLKK